MNSISELIEQRKDEKYSVAESRMALEIKAFGKDTFDRQYPIGPYFADFYFPKNKLVLEIDGKDYHTSPEQVAHDRKRDIYMNKQGYAVVRVTGSMAERNTSGVLSVIRAIDDVNTFFIKDNEDIKNLMIYYTHKKLK